MVLIVVIKGLRLLMSKEKEESLSIIRKNDYRDDLEDEVAMHVHRIMNNPVYKPFKTTKKYTHIEIPEFEPGDKRARLDWQMREIERSRNGYDGMTGNYYWFFNHTWIKHKTRGKIRPDFRATQMHFAKVVDEVINKKGWGLVNVKRRQIGMSTNFAAEHIYRCSFNRDWDIGMSSKSLIDGQNLFSKHKYVHRNCSPFMRAFVNTDRRDAMIFSKWIKSEQTWKGTGSSIISVAPTTTGHAGNAYRVLTLDEVGETDDIMGIWSNAEETLMDADGTRVGTPIMFGTMGDSTTVGKGLIEFWTNADQYRLVRHFLGGYSCALVDALGNDDVEESVRSIVYERKRRESLSKVIYSKYLQKWPLSIEDAFLPPSGAGVGSPILLNKQYVKLMDNPPLAHKGRMSANPEGVSFVADNNNGKIIIYERPELITNGYVAAIDPAEDDDLAKSRDNSNLSTAIIAKPYGLSAPRLVAEYVDRPAKLADYYEQLALLLQWYNNTPVVCEMNKGGFRLKDYFEPRWPKLLALAPRSFNSIKGGFDLKIGVKMTPERKSQMLGLGDAYVENYSEMIPSIRLIEEMKVFGNDHADDDLCAAFLWCLIALQSDRRLVTGIETEAAKNPNLRYETVHGVKQLVSRGNIVSPPTIKTKNPLFNKPR